MLYPSSFFVLVLSVAQSLYIPKRHEISHVPLDPLHVVRKRSFDQNLRISVFYDGTVDSLSADKKKLIQQRLVPEARAFWSGVLQVKQTTTPILLNRDCANGKFFTVAGQPRHCERRQIGSQSGCSSTTVCGTVQVQQDHLQACYSCKPGGLSCQKETGSTAGSGVTNSDYVLYVSAVQTDVCGSAATDGSGAAENVAYAGHCQQDQATDRPVFGFMNLCPDILSTSVNDFDRQLATVKHEILHALGFAVSLYAFFRDADGNPRTTRNSQNYPIVFNSEGGYYAWNDSTIKTVTRTDWQTRGGLVSHKINVMMTPKVKEMARKHFNCSSLEGMELENQGDSKTAFSHWEKRLLENEAMTGTFTQNPVFSDITFALLEDSGWYKPDYSKAEQLRWGKNGGCEFAKKSCSDLFNSSSGSFCSTPKVQQPFRLTCSRDRLAVALCNLVKYTENLLIEYQYFSSIQGVPAADLGLYGGSVQLSDFCPYHQEFTWTSQGVAVRGSRCRLSDNNPSSNFALETYSSQSMCIEQGKAWKRSGTVSGRTETALDWGSGCYKIKCEPSTEMYKIVFSSCSYTCKRSGDQISVTQEQDGWEYTGTLICPAYSDVCYDNSLQDTAGSAVETECTQTGPGGSGATVIPYLSVLFTSILLYSLLV